MTRWLTRCGGPTASREGSKSREQEVLLLLSDGRSQDQISRRLAIADRTARVHNLSLKDKLAAASTAQGVAKAYELRILQP